MQSRPGLHAGERHEHFSGLDVKGPSGRIKIRFCKHQWLVLSNRWRKTSPRFCGEQISPDFIVVLEKTEAAHGVVIGVRRAVDGYSQLLTSWQPRTILISSDDQLAFSLPGDDAVYFVRVGICLRIGPFAPPEEFLAENILGFETNREFPSKVMASVDAIASQNGKRRSQNLILKPTFAILPT